MHRRFSEIAFPPWGPGVDGLPALGNCDTRPGQRAARRRTTGASDGYDAPRAAPASRESRDVLAARRPDLHEALRRAADHGWAFVVLDGKLFDCDRVTETTLSVKGDTIDA
jgi:hypothetical protein